MCAHKAKLLQEYAYLPARKQRNDVVRNKLQTKSRRLYAKREAILSLKDILAWWKHNQKAIKSKAKYDNVLRETRLFTGKNGTFS